MKMLSASEPRLNHPSAGDTIVEVMISMTVLAVVVAAAYAISTRSFQSGLNTQYRDQAVNYAQQQLELIKEADNNSPSTISTYTASPGTSFCIDPVTKERKPSDSCQMNSLYDVNVTYDSTAKSFKVTTSWTSSDNHSQQTTLYYRPNNSFNGNTVACTAESDSCASTITNPPSVVISAAQSTINPGVSDILSWSHADIKEGSCAVSGPGGFGGADANANPGSYSFSTNTPGSYTFRINCTDNAGNPVSSSTTVTVLAPTINYFRVNGTNAPATVGISYKDQVTVSWDSSNTTGCTAAGPWSTNGARSGSVTTGRLASNSTFGLTCTTTAGGAISSANITVNVGPSGIYGYYYQGANFNAGGWGPYNDGDINNCADAGGCNNGWLSRLRSRTYLGEASCASVYWVGQILADTTGTYNIQTYSDDGVQVAINGNYVINNWSQHSGTYNSGNIYLGAGWNTVQVWYQNNNGNGCWTGNDYSADMQLIWIPPGAGSRNQVPQDHLRPY